MNKQDLDLTKKVKEMSLTQAADILDKIYSEEEKVGAEDVLGAYLRIWERYERLGSILQKANPGIKDTLKKADAQVNVKAVIDETKTISGTFGQSEKASDVIDWDTLKTEKGIKIYPDPANPARIIVEAGSAQDLTLFKTPSISGNPAAVEAAIAAGNLDGKYKQTKISVKSDIALTVSNN